MIENVSVQYIELIEGAKDPHDPWYKLKSIIADDLHGITIRDFVNYSFIPRITPLLCRIMNLETEGFQASDWKQNPESARIIEVLNTLKINVYDRNKVISADEKSLTKIKDLKSKIKDYVSQSEYCVGLNKGSSISVKLNDQINIVFVLEGLSKLKGGISTFDVFIVNEPLTHGLSNIRINYRNSVHLNSVTPFKLHRNSSLLFSFRELEEFEERISELMEFVLPSLVHLDWYRHYSKFPG